MGQHDQKSAISPCILQPRDELFCSILALPLLRDTSVVEQEELFVAKMYACRVLFDFTVRGHCKTVASILETQAREVKSETLCELAEYIASIKENISETMYAEVLAVVNVNIFRDGYVSKRRVSQEIETAEARLEPSWPHLALVYELFFQFVISNAVHPIIAQQYIDVDVVRKLLELFDSEDPREREQVKSLLHRIYGKFMYLRNFVRTNIQDTFLSVVYDGVSHRGMSELLEILASIINGFTLPLKTEHRQFLATALLPLHRVRWMHTFHHHLIICLGQYVEKDPYLAVTIVNTLLKYWPHKASAKQVIFLGELEDTLEMINEPVIFEIVKLRVFKKLAQCMRSSHFQVAERALYFWNNDNFSKLMTVYRTELYPILLEALLENLTLSSRCIWNNTVMTLSYNVFKMMQDVDEELFEEITASLRTRNEEKKKDRSIQQEQWESLTMAYDIYNVRIFKGAPKFSRLLLGSPELYANVAALGDETPSSDRS